MSISIIGRFSVWVVLLLSLSTNTSGADEQSAAEISRKLADPTSDIWAMFTAFQAQTYTGNIADDTEYGGAVLFEPIMPFPITDHWKMITRPVLTWAAAPVPNSIDVINGEARFDTEYGLVNAQLPFLFSPKSDSAFAWGLGPTFQTPNNTNSKLDDDNWEAGVGNVLIYKPTGWTIWNGIAVLVVD